MSLCDNKCVSNTILPANYSASTGVGAGLGAASDGWIDLAGLYGGQGVALNLTIGEVKLDATNFFELIIEGTAADTNDQPIADATGLANAIASKDICTTAPIENYVVGTDANGNDIFGVRMLLNDTSFADTAYKICVRQCPNTRFVRARLVANGSPSANLGVAIEAEKTNR